MPTMDFTAAKVAAIQPGPQLVEYQDARQPGLSLRVTPAGAKSWTMRYRLRNGSRKRVALGAFPAMPVSMARADAQRLAGDVARGGDPARERQEERRTEARQALDTIAAVGDRYLAEAQHGRHRMNGRPMRLGSLKLERDYLAVVKAKLGRARIADLTRADLQAFVNDTATERSAGAARHSRNVLQRIYAFAFWQDIVATDPMRFVSAPTWQERERILTDEELRALWRGLGAVAGMKEVSVSPAMVAAIRLAAVTLQRRGEVAGMRLDELDLKARLWTMPGARTKNGRTHVVPMSALALELVEAAIEARVGRGRDSPFVLPSPRDPERPIAPPAVTHAWLRLLPHLAIPAPTTDDPKRKRPVVGITPHDLRRTGATAITSERIGMPRFVVSRVLNHVSDGGGSAAVTAVYDRNAYLREKRAALDAWAALILEIVEDKQRPVNVVPLGR